MDKGIVIFSLSVYDMKNNFCLFERPFEIQKNGVFLSNRTSQSTNNAEDEYKYHAVFVLQRTG